MQIIPEAKFYGFLPYDEDEDSVDENIAFVLLETGVWLLVREGGTAVDPNGKQYACVSEEVEGKPFLPDDPYMLPFTYEEMDQELPETFPIPDTTLVTIGWTPDSATPVIMTRVDGELRIAE